MRLSRFLSSTASSVAETIAEFAARKQTPTTLQQFVVFGKNPTTEKAHMSAKFLHRELPVRLAHMTREIDALPPVLLQTRSVQRVRSWYVQSFKELIELPELPEGEFNPVFSRTLRTILERHAPVVITIARGLLEMKMKTKAESGDSVDPSTQYFLDRFYMSRIGIRMLIGQHLDLFSSGGSGVRSKDSTHVGIIDQKCNVRLVADDAVYNARYLCNQTYLCAPEVEICMPQQKYAEGEITFPYVPSHLYHMLFEVVKNSVRAVVEFHGPDCATLPPVKIYIVKGDQEDISIKISDQGGGIARSGLPLLYTYMYTTAQQPALSTEDEVDMNNAPLAGFGYGLPLSRLYARYFGGDLQVVSMEGFGTDAYIFLKRAAEEAGEVLPEFSPEAVAPYQNGGPDSTFNDWMQG